MPKNKINKSLPEELPLPQQTFLPTQEPVNKQKVPLSRTEEFIIYMTILFFIEFNILTSEHSWLCLATKL